MFKLFYRIRYIIKYYETVPLIDASSLALTKAVEAVARGCGDGATISPQPVNGSRSGSRSSRVVMGTIRS